MERVATFKNVVAKEGEEEEFLDLRFFLRILGIRENESPRPLTFESIKIPNDRVLFLERDFTGFTLIRGVCMFKSDTGALFIECLNSFRKGRITVLSNREAIESGRARKRWIEGERDRSEFQ